MPLKPIRNILVGTDFSSASRPAFRRAVDLAASNGAELWIAHVLALPAVLGMEGYVLPRTYDEIALVIRQDAQKRLQRLLSLAQRAGVRARSLVLNGVPHEALNRSAHRHRADLMVLGTHGRTGLARIFVGSVSSRVVATAPCPVLTVRGR
jgi:nucleotide-binding universal stress UspA family protein